MGIKNHDKLIPWEVVRRENFVEIDAGCQCNGYAN